MLRFHLFTSHASYFVFSPKMVGGYGCGFHSVCPALVFCLLLFDSGVYVQLSGPRVDAMAYAEWVKKDPRFSSIFIQVSPCLHHHAFPRLKLRYKPSLVQVRTCLFGFH
jgi:hypothetical protein